jgi:general secretion pathway protein D
MRMKGTHRGTPRGRGFTVFRHALLLLAGCWSTLLLAQTVTLNLKDADISALIGTVAEVTDTNFIVDPRVKGKITVISSRPMNSDEIYQVFLSILKVHGFAAVPTGEVVKIVPDVNAKQDAIPNATEESPGQGDEMVTRVVQVDNVSAAQLVPILRPLVPQQGHLAAYPATNMLILSDRADNVERLVSIIHRIDQESDSEIEVIPLEHASATEVVRILNTLGRAQPAAAKGAAAGVADGLALIADERTNSVLLGGGRADRLRLRVIISHLDTPLERGGNTHVVYLKYAKAQDLVDVLTGVSQGIEEDQKGGQAAAAKSKGLAINIQADEAANALVITTPPDVFRSLQTVIRQLDIRRAQVHVEALIAEITNSAQAALGVQWQSTQNTDNKGAIGGTNFSIPGVPSIGAVATDPLSNVGRGLTVGLIDGTRTILGTEILNLGALITAVAGDTNNNILATPNLVTLDNQEAEIVVAQNIPFVTGQFTNTGAAQGSVNPFQTIERQDVGLTLKIKPQINEGDAIQLEIQQEVSNVSPTQVPGASDIVTVVRNINTTVLVQDHQMVVLGGLIDDQTQENIEKVPFLGDLPFLGNLFKARSTSKVKRNLMVFIQPSIIRDAATETEIAAGKYNFIRARQQAGKKKGMDLMPKHEVADLPPFPTLLESPGLTPQALPPVPKDTDNPAVVPKEKDVPAAAPKSPKTFAPVPEPY